MGTERVARHQLLRHLLRQIRLQPACGVDGGKFTLLCGRIFQKLGLLARQIGFFGIGLRVNRHVLASGHRHRPSHQARHTRYQNAVLAGACCRDAYDKAGGRHDAIVSPQDGSAQPADAVDAVIFTVGGASQWVLERRIEIAVVEWSSRVFGFRRGAGSG